MPHMSNLPWSLMFVSCFVSVWVSIAIFNFKSANSQSTPVGNKIKSTNQWEW